MSGPNIKERILACIKAEPRGLTTREVAERLAAEPAKVRPRISELYGAGLIAPGPYRRRTAQGGVWRENIWHAPPEAK
jgi:predicted transcriptional regulator